MTYDTLSRIPQVARAAFEQARVAMVKARSLSARTVIIVATGEARVAADLLAVALNELALQPVVVHAERTLPAWAGDGDLVIFASLTGSAPECVAAFADAADRRCHLATVSAGGRLSEMSNATGCPRVDLGEDAAGAAAFAACFFGMAGLAAAVAMPNAGRAFAVDVEETLALMERLRDAYGPGIALDRNPARLVAETLQEIQPALFGSSGIARAAAPVIARRLWQVGSQTAAVGELAIEGDDTAAAPAGDAAVVLRDSADSYDWLAALPWPEEAIHEIELAGKSSLEKAWSAITLFDWAAFYLAP